MSTAPRRQGQVVLSLPASLSGIDIMLHDPQETVAKTSGSKRCEKKAPNFVQISP
jgi:hypothetical protein